MGEGRRKGEEGEGEVGRRERKGKGGRRKGEDSGGMKLLISLPPFPSLSLSLPCGYYSFLHSSPPFLPPFPNTPPILHIALFPSIFSPLTPTCPQFLLLCTPFHSYLLHLLFFLLHQRTLCLLHPLSFLLTANSFLPSLLFLLPPSLAPPSFLTQLKTASEPAIKFSITLTQVTMRFNSGDAAS